MTDRSSLCTARAPGGTPGVFATAAFGALLAIAPATPAPAGAQETPEAVEYCLMCHEDESLTLELEDGSMLELGVDRASYLASVHGDELLCTDCHAGYDTDEHPSGVTFPSRRQYVLASYEVCKQCHFDTYTRTLESIHFDYLKAGLEEAPVCTDCHGAHAVADPHAKQAMISRSCGSCHDRVYRMYAESVHGKALVQEGIEDVPGCADCHTAHSIADPSSPAFHIRSPGVCIDCHGDPERMARYDVPVNVATTYLADFHGVTATLADPEAVDERRLVVTCVDCHGEHDVVSPALLREGEMKEKVARVCADCHEGAAQDFPAAWLSHFRPSLDHAPLVFLVELFYSILIPFMVLGLALQVGLHLYRVAVRR
ncbi:MAG: cytochrome c3 family protein [Thermoanaerobaculia bacterium]